MGRTIVLLSHYSRRLSSLATRAICSHLHNKLNVASVVEAGTREAVVPLSPPDIPCQCQLQFQHFFSAARPFIPSFFSSVCLAVRSCVFMRSAKAINIVIIATFTSPVCQAIQHSAFTVHHSPFAIHHSSSFRALLPHGFILWLLLTTLMSYLGDTLSIALPVAPCWLPVAA